MCFYLDPEFVKVRRVTTDNSSLDAALKISDEVRTDGRKESLASFGQLVSGLPSATWTVVAIKWILFILCACF